MTNLGLVIKAFLQSPDAQQTLRGLSVETGVPTSTLSRIQNGQTVTQIELDNWLKLQDWLLKPAAQTSQGQANGNV